MKNLFYYEKKNKYIDSITKKIPINAIISLE